MTRPASGDPPLVSICVPTFNRADLLRESLATILAQDYGRLEIVISDNGSQDDTEKVCRAAAEADPRVRYLRQPRNIGLYPNHNALIGASRGEFLAFFHDDDGYSPGTVSRYVQFMRQHPDVGLVCSDWDLVDDEGRPIGARRSRAPDVMDGRAYIERTIRSARSTLCCPGTLIRRAALGDVRFDEAGPLGFGDFVVWFQIAERWAVGHVRERLWRYRLHRGSLSGRKIAAIVDDYEEHVTRYCDGFARRWPGEAARVARWRRLARAYIFWALAYELSLHFRTAVAGAPAGGTARTSFELKGYQLTAEELERVRGSLARYRSSPGQHAAYGVIEGLLALNVTRPLAWATRYPGALRGLLHLR